MNDRELLEAAAKAAGDVHYDYGKWFTRMGESWHPLTDDGDALRLAVKLGMSLDTALGQTLATCPVQGKDCVEPHGRDPYAATRRAIVRAAAAIGSKP
jgi:hypothetical protein